MVVETSARLGTCAWCERDAVVVHLNFPMCGACFADTSLGFYDKVGFEQWLADLPRDVAEQIVRAMLRNRRAAMT